MENTIQLSPMDLFQQEVEKRQAELDQLRLDGVTKIENLKNEITNVKKNKQLDAETKGKLINQCKKELEEARAVRDANKEEVHTKVNEFINYIRTTTDSFINPKKEENKTKKAEFKSKFTADVAEENERYNNEVNEIKSAGGEDVALKLKDAKVKHRQIFNDLKAAYQDSVDKVNDELHQIYLTRFNAIEAANNKRLPVVDNFHQKAENYVYSFNWKKFMLNNGLYLAIILMLIVAIIMYAVQSGGFLLNWSTITLILNQTAPKIFLALGVAGLIVLAGTDLSVGRLVGLAAVLTGMLVTTSGTTGVEFFGVSPDFSGLPLGFRVFLGFLLSIIACAMVV